MSTAIEYVRAGVVRQSSVPLSKLLESYVSKNGWVLVSIPRGLKSPRTVGWNRRENCITTPEQAQGLTGNLGIAHAYCDPPTAALDIDRLDDARTYFHQHGIDLDALLCAPNSIGINSGRPNRAKLLYTLPEPLATLRLADGAFELRCATRDSSTVIDILPPSLHPEGQIYRWILGSQTSGTKPPPVPEELLAFWRSNLPIVSQSSPPSAVPSGDAAALRELIANRDPDVAYDEWLRVGMALHHETRGSDSGLAVWDEWSANGKKYKGPSDLETHWRSFRGNVPHPVTIGSLLREVVAQPDAFPEVPGAKVDGVRAVVQLRAGELHNYAAQCESILRQRIYVRERALVRIGGAQELEADGANDIRRDGTQAVIIPASAEYLRRLLSQSARFETYRRREKTWVPVDCPKDLAANIAGQGDWPNMRRLEAIARAPFIRADGSICEAPGYDSRSRVFHAPNADFPAVPANPNRADADRALAMLLETFDEFPFANEAGRSAFVANILSEAVRAAVDTSPAFFYTAPTPGTGKTLLSEMPSRIVHGCGPSLRPWVESSDELRKNLLASLLAGDRTIGYDNVPNGMKVRSPFLCLFLTADVYSDRKLGVSEVPAVPNRSVVFVTGNNVTPAGDLARRSIVIRLDADTDQLRGRTFRFADLRAHVSGIRAELLVAALTIVRAYLTAGDSVKAIPLPSFERWSKYARDPLLWLGMADPVATQADETDDEEAPLADAFRRIAESPEIGEREFSASDLASVCIFDAKEGLSAAIDAAGCSDPSNAKHVGYWLRDKRDRIAGGWKLERLRATNGVATWRFRQITRATPAQV
jgi:putative DNA primase/helicase